MKRVHKQGSISGAALVILLAVSMVASMIFVGFTVQQLLTNASDERAWISTVTEIQVSSQRLSKSASEAALGILAAFDDLIETHARMARDMNVLTSGSPEGGVSPLPIEVSKELSSLHLKWNQVSANATAIVERQPLVNELASSGAILFDMVPDLQAGADRAVRQLIEGGATNPQVFVASNQLVLADRMLRRIREILQNGSNAPDAVDNLRTEMRMFDQVLAGLIRGDPNLGVTPVRNQQAITTLSSVRRDLERARPHIQVVLESAPEFFELRGAADEIYRNSQEMFDKAGALSAGIARLPRARLWPSLQTATLGSAIMIILVAILVAMSIMSARRRAEVAHMHNRKTQKAILRLLDELESLADGDLTVHASVADEITGAIADAVNYAVEKLVELVTEINNTALQVAESAEATRGSTSQLATAAGEQAEQITRVAEKIQAMSSALQTMAERCRDSSESAMESVSIAHAGADKVRETIHGMDIIREQIQQTSKRIKRLGESSQEIGDIVSLINDIAEQTNVLALNAAIQAASAGNTGQGFAVVADEVQQLAESATNATRRISTLVQTIQADTGEAVKSMEDTTSEVVNGAKLAQDAGQALVKIEESSNELSELIQQISNEALQQSQQGTRISQLMGGIREVSVKTSTGSSRAADEVSELADLVLRLRESVSDFKLPGHVEEEPARQRVGAG